MAMTRHLTDMRNSSAQDAIELNEICERFGLKEVYKSFPADCLSAQKRMKSLKHALHECLLASDLHHTISGREQ